MPKSLGRVRVNYIFYETPRELVALLRDIHVAHLEDDGATQYIVLALPLALHRLMKWPATLTPMPEIHDDVIVFKKAPM